MRDQKGQRIAELVNSSDEAWIDALRLKAFKSNDAGDKLVYFEAVSRWFQGRDSRRLAALEAERAEAVTEMMTNEFRELLTRVDLLSEWQKGYLAEYLDSSPIVISVVEPTPPPAPDVERMREALTELWEWVKNWDPSFTDDDEWPATAAKVRAALTPTPTEGSAK